MSVIPCGGNTKWTVIFLSVQWRLAVEHDVSSTFTNKGLNVKDYDKMINLIIDKKIYIFLLVEKATGWGETSAIE